MKINLTEAENALRALMAEFGIGAQTSFVEVLLANHSLVGRRVKVRMTAFTNKNLIHETSQTVEGALILMRAALQRHFSEPTSEDCLVGHLEVIIDEVKP